MSDKPATPVVSRSNAMVDRCVRLQHLVRHLSHPIDYASRSPSARRSTLATLGPFVVRQIVTALSEEVFAPPIEADLLTLRDLFADFGGHLPSGDQERRLAAARLILARLHDRATQPMAPGNATPSARQRTPVARARTDVATTSIQFAAGVGPKRAVLLERLGIRSIEDALWFLPWRYEDRSKIVPIATLTPGMDATVCGVVTAVTVKRTARRGFSIVTLRVRDDSGTVSAVYFNQPYLEAMFSSASRVCLSGPVTAGPKGWTDVQFENPRYDVLSGETDTLLHVGRIVPIYHETKGLSGRQLRVILKGVLDAHLPDVDELLPSPMREARRLPSIQRAFAEVHFPSAGTNVEALNRGITPAHRRLVFEECLLLELALALRHRAVQDEAKGIRFDVETPLIARLRRLLPFALTPAQERVVDDIRHDMGATRPMNRLVQGDVGCGKTVVALHALLIACGSQYQAALMAPTEILAEQHYFSLKPLLHELGLTVVLLRSGGRRHARAAAREHIESGHAHVVVGTHALIQKGVRFRQLGVVVIDEQHKFGVLQRKTLVEKGYRPDVLVMTATPIPRTLALTVHGDLDVSVIDALPPGRKPVQTSLFSADQRRRAYRLVEDELQAGRQAYIVYPLVEESEKVDLQAVIQAAARLQAGEFSAYRVAILHGRMKSEEKEQTMAAYKAGHIHILVATTVIEVGVDVPQASVMLIEHADRFGLAQLHQLRGRVGRGPHQSHCLLVTTAGTRDAGRGQDASLASQRLNALVRSHDGFVIAEEDLRIRGPGEFFGLRQWGMPELRAVNLIRDRALLEDARAEAFALVARDPGLRDPAHARLRHALLRRWKDRLNLASVS